MLVEHSNESAARLPYRLRRMDIKDLLHPRQSPRPRQQADLTSTSSPPPRPRLIPPASDLPLKSGSGTHPILPSPTQTSTYAPDPNCHRRSPPPPPPPPYSLKTEYSTQIHPGWNGHVQHPAAYNSYQGYDHATHYSTPSTSAYSPNKRALSLDDNSSKRSKKPKGSNQKWDAEEDARIIELRGSGMKWGDISKHLPGRTEIGCRLHYQNYLEKRGQWDEEKKTKLARVYERMKADLWQPLAHEMGVPWRSAEAMHWIMGEKEMARRANTIPFAMVNGPNSAGPQGEGNGRIAQANRMHESTIYFEPGDVAALQAGQERRGPVSTFGHPAYLRACGGTGSDYATEGGQQDYESEVDSPTDESRQRMSTQEGEFVKREGKMAEEGGWRLPGLADLDNGISAFVGHGSRCMREEGSHHHPKGGPGPTTVQLGSSDASSSGDRSNRNSSGSLQSHHDKHRESGTLKEPCASSSSRRGSNGSDGSTSTSTTSGGYVQVTRKTRDENA